MKSTLGKAALGVGDLRNAERYQIANVSEERLRFS